MQVETLKQRMKAHEEQNSNGPQGVAANHALTNMNDRRPLNGTQKPGQGTSPEMVRHAVPAYAA